MRPAYCFTGDQCQCVTNRHFVDTLHAILALASPTLNVNSIKIIHIESRQLIISRYNIHCCSAKVLKMPEHHNSSPLHTENKVPEKQPSLLWNLAFNLIIPALILSKLSGNEFLGIKLAIIAALAFPIAYGVKDFTRAGKINFFSGLGVVNVSLTGGISLLELDAIYIAIKEASIPALLGIATILSLKTSQPLINTFLLNKSVLNIKKITNALTENKSHPAFDKLLVNASWILAGSFFLSALLNYILAVVLLTADPGSVEFNQQLGKMTALSFPVISLPLMVVLTADLFYIFRGIKRLTGMPLEEILNVDIEKK